MSDTLYAVKSGFFDAINHDRLYSADDMNQPYKEILTEGIDAGGFEVTPQSTPDMTITVAAGHAFLGGKWVDAAAKTLTVPENTTLYGRIDAVVLRVDINSDVRAANLIYRTGTPADTPEVPALIGTTGIYEVRLANIAVAASAAAIAAAQITDKRGGTDCPYADIKLGQLVREQQIAEEVSSWLTEHVDPVGSAVVVDDSLSIAGAAADAKKTGDEISGLKDALDDNLLDYIEHHESTNHLNPNTITDGSINADGTINPTGTAKVSDYIDVTGVAKVRCVYVINNTNETLSFKFAFYDVDKVFISGDISFQNVANCPANAKYIRVQISTSYFQYPVAVTFDIATSSYVYEDYYTPYDNYTRDFITNETKAKIEKLTLGHSIQIKTTKESLVTGETLTVVENVDCKKGQIIDFYGNITSFSDITIGHGYNQNDANWVVIDETDIKPYYDQEIAYTPTPHGLTIDGFIHVRITQKNNQRGSLELITDTGSYSLGDMPWVASNGSIYAKVTGTLSNVIMSATFPDLICDLFIFGDSYVSMFNERWVYYLINTTNGAGYTKEYVDGYGGRTSQGALPAFNTVMSLSKPKYLCWFLGMNDPDTSNAVNSNWKSAIDEVIAYCIANDIIPILATIPNTPTTLHTYKNAYVKSLGYRYVDFAKAVNAENANASWYTGMLKSDNVHPTALGAKALYARFIADVPEAINP